MKKYTISLLAIVVILFAFGANAQEEEKEAGKKDLCANISCSHHGICVVTYVAGNAMPTCACDNGYAPDTVNGLSCQPVNQPAPKATSEPEDESSEFEYEDDSQPASAKNSAAYSDRFFPYNTMSDAELRLAARSFKRAAIATLVLELVGVGIMAGGTAMLFVSSPLGGAIVLTLGTIIWLPCFISSIVNGVRRRHLLQYMKLRGIATLQNPYLAIRDETITQFAF